MEKIYILAKKLNRDIKKVDITVILGLHKILFKE